MEPLPTDLGDNVKGFARLIHDCQEEMKNASMIPAQFCVFNVEILSKRIEEIKKHEFKFWPFYGYWHNGLFWIRFVTGHGLHIKNSKKHGLIFSERNGFAGFSIGKYHFKLLRPNN